MAASESLMAILHDAVARDLLERIKGTPILNEAGEVVGHMKASASDVANALKMLKDNNITCKPDKANALGELTEELSNRQAEMGMTDNDKSVLEAALAEMGGGNC